MSAQLSYKITRESDLLPLSSTAQEQIPMDRDPRGAVLSWAESALSVLDSAWRVELKLRSVTTDGQTGPQCTIPWGGDAPEGTAIALNSLQARQELELTSILGKGFADLTVSGYRLLQKEVLNMGRELAQALGQVSYYKAKYEEQSKYLDIIAARGSDTSQLMTDAGMLIQSFGALKFKLAQARDRLAQEPRAALLLLTETDGDGNSALGLMARAASNEALGRAIALLMVEAERRSGEDESGSADTA
ncbi:MAG TPA: hypothetical protein PK625_00140 [Spirochaetales bacterium]|nr:hypothetical protein [Spirochaetales bacterium]